MKLFLPYFFTFIYLVYHATMLPHHITMLPNYGLLQLRQDPILYPHVFGLLFARPEHLPYDAAKGDN